MKNLRNRVQLWVPALAIVGGLTWIAYAILTMLQPGGGDGVPGDPGDPASVRWAIGAAGAAVI